MGGRDADQGDVGKSNGEMKYREGTGRDGPKIDTCGITISFTMDPEGKARVYECFHIDHGIVCFPLPLLTRPRCTDGIKIFTVTAAIK